jgi:hypothetical protein
VEGIKTISNGGIEQRVGNEKSGYFLTLIPEGSETEG